MVKLYFEKPSEEEKEDREFLEIPFWTMTKATFLGWLGINLIVWGIVGIFVLIGLIAALIFSL